ncbi:MAG: hypothetical protein HZA92_16380 [Verrucomicrobia bacterium]|nr:hypothetical protein [Verrucomicrobiota bacterium]
MKTTSALLWMALTLTAVTARADYWHVPPRGNTLQLEYEAGAAYLAGSRLSLGSTRLGNIESAHTHLVAGVAVRASDDFTFRVAAEYRRNDFEVGPGVPIPNVLGNVGLQLTGNWALRNNLSLWLNARPGIYSDFRDLGFSDLNVPFNVVLAWQRDEDLMWLLGVYVDLRAEFPVFGGPGVRWRFADYWTLNLVMPRPRLEFQATDDLLLYGGAEWRQVSYRVARDLGTKAGNPSLNNQMLDYRELRLGVGLNYSFNRHFNLGLEGGYAPERRFHYYSAKTQLTDNGSGYVAATLNGRF